MANVVVRAPLDLAGPHRQQWLRTIERLDLRLVVGTQDDCAIRRMEIEPADVANLLDEEYEE